MWFYSFYFQEERKETEEERGTLFSFIGPWNFFNFYRMRGPRFSSHVALAHPCLFVHPSMGEGICNGFASPSEKSKVRKSIGRLESGSWATQVSDVLQHGFPSLLGGAHFEWPTYHLRSTCDWKRSHFHASRRIPFTCFSPAFTLISAIHLIHSHQSPIFTHR